MRGLTRGLLILTPIAFLSLGAFYGCSVKDSPYSNNYGRVQVGMTVEEVEAILGPGSSVKQSEVPTVVVAVNPADVQASEERAKRAGRWPQTARDYPVRHKPVVEGDLILKWVDDRTGERILVAFKDGKVCEKHYWDPNYL